MSVDRGPRRYSHIVAEQVRLAVHEHPYASRITALFVFASLLIRSYNLIQPKLEFETHSARPATVNFNRSLSKVLATGTLTTHVVEPGDTLAGITYKCGGPVNHTGGTLLPGDVVLVGSGAFGPIQDGCTSLLEYLQRCPRVQPTVVGFDAPESKLAESAGTNTGGLRALTAFYQLKGSPPSVTDPTFIAAMNTANHRTIGINGKIGFNCKQ